MINRVQTIGQASKGIVYCIIGALTALAAFDMGGQKAGKSDVINFLQEQPFGQFIVIALSLGIVAYALWRFYKAIADPKNKGDDASGFAKRFGYFSSGLVYLLFAISVLTSVTGTGGGGSQQYFLAELMTQSYGPALIGLAGIILIGVGVYQIYKGYSGKYLHELNAMRTSRHNLLKNSGKFGYMARGVVFGIIGYFVTMAAVTQNTTMVRGTQGAFTFLQQQSYGYLLMGIVAIGLLGHGIFMLFVAKYSSVSR